MVSTRATQEASLCFLFCFYAFSIVFRSGLAGFISERSRENKVVWVVMWERLGGVSGEREYDQNIF